MVSRRSIRRTVHFGNKLLGDGKNNIAGLNKLSNVTDNTHTKGKP